MLLDEYDLIFSSLITILFYLFLDYNFYPFIMTFIQRIINHLKLDRKNKKSAAADRTSTRYLIDRSAPAIGDGANGSVMKSANKIDFKPCAVKSISYSTEKDKRLATAELLTWQRLSENPHPNVLSLIES